MPTTDVTDDIQETPRLAGENPGVTVTPEARLLVVDDEPSIRELLTASLRFAGFEVVGAADGAEALRMAEQHRPDLVILDVMLPDLDGFTVTRRLRERGRCCSSPPATTCTTRCRG